MFDLIALGVSGERHARRDLLHGGEGTNRTYNHIGVPDAFHPLSHHAND